MAGSLWSVVIERGAMADYEGLKEFHYLGGRPGVVERVYRALAPEKGNSPQSCREHRGGKERQLLMRNRGHPAGDERDGRPIGVLVVSYPMLHCRGRDMATGGRYRGMSAGKSARLINKGVRLISRVIVSPQWRGSGVAAALVRRALEESTTVYTEALAAMGRAFPFFERAGMERVVVPPRLEHVRLRGVLDEVGLVRAVLVSSRRSREVLDARSATEVEFLNKELRRWWRSVGRVTKREAAEVAGEELLREARRRVWVEPWYFIWRSQDSGVGIQNPDETETFREQGG